MTLITLSYTKNPDRERIHSDGGYHLRVTRASGRVAMPEEVDALIDGYSQARIDKQVRIDYSGVEPCAPGSYRIEIKRDDGLPLMDEEVDALLMTQALGRFGRNQPPVIISPNTVLALVAELEPPVGRAWLQAIQQMEPDCVPQLVRIPDRPTAIVLAEAGLLESYGDPADDQYMIPTAIARCSWQ
jgi:hypothetical protein